MWPGIYYCVCQHGVLLCVHTQLVTVHVHTACYVHVSLCMHKQQATVPTYAACYLHLYTSNCCRCIHSVLLCLPAQRGTNTVMPEGCHNNLLMRKQCHDAQTSKQGGCALEASRRGRFCFWAILVLKKLFLGHRLAVSGIRT
jgi:hypothetical protein